MDNIDTSSKSCNGKNKAGVLILDMRDDHWQDNIGGAFRTIFNIE